MSAALESPIATRATVRRRTARDDSTFRDAASRSALCGGAILILALHFGGFALQSAASGALPAPLAMAGGDTPRLTPQCARFRLDPNTATAQELTLLPAIGPARARAIVDYRNSQPDGRAYQSPQDLDFVRGIGQATVAELEPWLAFPAPADSRPAPRRKAE